MVELVPLLGFIERYMRRDGRQALGVGWYTEITFETGCRLWVSDEISKND